MYAVMVSGGKQHKVSPGKNIKLETLSAEVGEKVTFDVVLMVGDGDNIKIGTPHVKGGKVSGTVVSHGRAKKVHIIKFKRRKHSMKQQGHRQNFTEVQIDEITS